MPYALRARKTAATAVPGKEAKATSPPPSKKTLNTVIAQIKDLGENGVKRLKKAQGPIKKAHPKVKADAEKAHKRVIKQIQTLASSKPSETKQKQSIAKNRESVTAQIAKRAVLSEVKSLGAGNPIKRVAKVHVKRGVNLKSVNGGGVKDARTSKRIASQRKIKTSAKSLQKAVQSEIKRIAAQTPSEAKQKTAVAQKYTAVKQEIKKRAVLQEIKKVGATQLKKVTKSK
ncbi:hypothetical protein HDU97_001204 [Phlyctochytrium planicorne]|nr:hypothetical protein HDU97_001204 [Phlyctochytrium planicorne]